jgi:integrase
MQVRLTQDFFDKAKAQAGEARTIYWDEDQPGFGLMVTERGAKSYVVQYRAGRVSRRMTLRGVLRVGEARKEAKGYLGQVAKGNDPLAARRQKAAEATNSLKTICEEYLKWEAKKLRTGDHRRAELERLIYPAFGARQIETIKRSDIVRLLDKIEAGELRDKNGKIIEGGAVQADRTLALIRRIMNWHATRSDDFRSPIVRGMARTKPKEHARERILSDDEIRAMWKTAEQGGKIFGHYLQFVLLTATRRNEAAEASRAEISGSAWTIPSDRYKTGIDFVVPLSSAAVEILEKVPTIAGCQYIFTTDGKNPISGWTKFKADVDKRSGVTDWTIHDLRRTARSLMSRAGVSADHAERCLGHVIAGVRGVYDRHEYFEEKKRAFEALAAIITRILNPKDNVIEICGDRIART